METLNPDVHKNIVRICLAFNIPLKDENGNFNSLEMLREKIVNVL